MEADGDDSGTIDFPEFLALMASVVIHNFRILSNLVQVVGNRSEDSIFEAFKVFDKDEDGFLTVSIFKLRSSKYILIQNQCYLLFTKKGKIG